jgi:MoxR-like ATPase
MNAPHDTALCADVTPLAWADANQQWLVGALGRLREQLERGTTDQLETPREAACAQPLPERAGPGFQPALLRCTQVFGLSLFERELLLLAAGVELDASLRQALAALQGGVARLNFGIGLSLLPQAHWDAVSPDGALRYWRLLEIEPGLPVTEAPLRIDERMLHFVAGIGANEPRLRGLARYVEGRDGAAEAALSPLVARVAAALRAPDERGPLVVLHNEPADPAALRDAALGVVAGMGRPALWITAADLPGDAAELALLARLIDREAALHEAVPVLAVHGQGEAAALTLADQLRCAAIWLGPAAVGLLAAPTARRVRRFEWPQPDATQAFDAFVARWRGAGLPLDDEATVSALRRASRQFQLGPTALDEVIESLAAEAENPAPQALAGVVWTAAREASRGGLDALAQRIDGGADFDDLVLPAAQASMLRDIARHLRYRERVYREWGFGEHQTRGLGLTALFAGESGTGKTLAAEAIAQAAGLDLYRVDLATVVSKYIGETEKNLRRLFDAAEASGAVLLFDEADALFGKRSEVKDSHDRYANIEVAYLLQRVEAYRGLAILTTNMKSALDRAFLRRIRFVVTFPFPDQAAREQIWRRQFPPRAPLGTLDYAALARWPVAGGSIRSIALSAAFKAADAGRPIDQALLLEAARAEFAKLERSFSDGGGGAAT